MYGGGGDFDGGLKFEEGSVCEMFECSGDK